jgi:hypothetical protein
MHVKRALSAALGLLALNAFLPVSAPAEDTEPIAIPTSATIFNGKLIDRIPNPPSARLGPTRRPNGVSVPFYGRISSSQPACVRGRAYQFGSYPGSYPGFISKEEFSFGGSNHVPEGGKWFTELESTWSRPLVFAIRVPPKNVVYKGVTYRCEEVISPEIVVDKSDFTPCKLARAAKRGYAPAIKVTKRLLREAEAHKWPIARRYRKDLKRYRSYWPAIRQEVARRC